LHAHGITRATADLDLVTVREAQGALVESLERTGYETLYRSEGYSNHVHADPVPKPEHLIAMKVQAIKNDPRRAFKDLADVQALMRLPEVDDAEALHRLRDGRPLSTEQYLRFLSRLEPQSPETLRVRPGPRGAPFVLD
jgi:hypothetical protein